MSAPDPYQSIATGISRSYAPAVAPESGSTGPSATTEIPGITSAHIAMFSIGRCFSAIFRTFPPHATIYGSSSALVITGFVVAFVHVARSSDQALPM